MALVNRLLVVLLALALLCGGALLVVETIASLAGADPVLVDAGAATSRASELSWDDPPVTGTAAALIAIGAVLLLLQLLPRQPESLPLQPGADRSAEVDRKALGAHLVRRVRSDEEVLGARATVKRRKVKVRAKAQPGVESRAVKERLTAMVAEDLRGIGLQRPLRTAVGVARSRERT